MGDCACCFEYYFWNFLEIIVCSNMELLVGRAFEKTTLGAWGTLARHLAHFLFARDIKYSPFVSFLLGLRRSVYVIR